MPPHPLHSSPTPTERPYLLSCTALGSVHRSRHYQPTVSARFRRTSLPTCCVGAVVQFCSANTPTRSRLWGYTLRMSTEIGRELCPEGVCADEPAQALKAMEHANGDTAEDGEEGVKVYCPPDLQQVLFVQTGFGADQHGQNATKACARACRNAIEFNSLPAIRQLVPNGYDGMKLKVKIGTPHPDTVRVDELMKVFPYGKADFEIVEGGLCASSGIALKSMGDENDDMLIAVAAVTVGY